jgi:hypothetical protein
MSAVSRALHGVAQLHRMGAAYALALDELDKALLADRALAAAVDLVISGADAAGDAANEFRAASRILTGRDDAEGMTLALDIGATASTTHEVRREIAAIRTRIDEINRLILAAKGRIETAAATVQAHKERGQQYAHRIAQ